MKKQDKIIEVKIITRETAIIILTLKLKNVFSFIILKGWKY